MITSGTIQRGNLILSAESQQDASMVKGGLAGKNIYLTTAPYGNRIDLSLDNSVLAFAKHSSLPMTYEEVRTLIKKIQMFGRINEKSAEHILEQARNILNSKLTMFFPSIAHPTVEVAFSYNWASLEFNSANFETIFPDIRKTIVVHQGPSIKVFSNNKDIISIHNYNMRGIYICRKSFEGIADILIANNIIKEPQKNAFVARATAFGVKSVTFMEARQLCQNTDETFSFADESRYNPLIGKQAFMIEIAQILEKLSEDGGLKNLNNDQIKTLHTLHTNPRNIERYSLAETIREALSALIEDFGEEIGDAFRTSLI